MKILYMKHTKRKTSITAAKKPTKETVVATSLNHLRRVVFETIKSEGKTIDLNFIDVSNITSMDSLFDSSDFNGNISDWDVSKVTTMSDMFSYSRFNGDLSKWNVSRVTDMSDMFSYSRFNGDISKWNVSNVKDTQGMFNKSVFNKDISKWNVSNVTNMSNMFEKAKFNKDISKWNVSSVTNMYGIFNNSSFSGDISNWSLNKLKQSFELFRHAKKIPNNHLPEKFNNLIEATSLDIGDTTMHKLRVSTNLQKTNKSKISNTTTAAGVGRMDNIKTANRLLKGINVSLEKGDPATDLINTVFQKFNFDVYSKSALIAAVYLSPAFSVDEDIEDMKAKIDNPKFKALLVSFKRMLS